MLSTTLLTSVVLTVAVWSAPPVEKKVIVEQAIAAYEKLDTLSFEVQIRIDQPGFGRRLPDPVKQTLDVAVSMSDGGKFRVEAMEGKKPFATLVCDGKQVFEWVAAENVWTRQPAPDVGKKANASLRCRLVEHPLTSYGSRWIDAKSPFINRLENMAASPLVKSVGRKKVSGQDCDVLKFTETAEGQGGPAVTETMTMCFDRASHLLIKEEQAVVAKLGSSVLFEGGKSMRYRRIRPNAELPPETFVFTPPTGSKFMSLDELRSKKLAPPPPLPVLDGQTAPPFSLPTVKGKTVSLADFKGKKIVLLSFWATWCGPCKLEMPMLCNLHKELGDKGLAVLGISSEVDLKNIKYFLEDRPLPYPILHDAKSAVAKPYHIEMLPTTLLIDKTGKVIKTWRGWGGAGEEAEIRKLIAKLL